MTNFTLWQKKEKVFPEIIIDEGETFFIDADFRTILKILAIRNDASIVPFQKPFLQANKFFKDGIQDVERGDRLFITFMNNFFDNKSDDKNPPEFDFDFDADVIFISFMSEYALNLLSVPFLHWYEFQLLLNGLSFESAFNRRIQLRFMDLKDLKGEEQSKTQEAKEKVQLPIVLTKKEIQEQQEFQDKWANVGR